MQFDDIMDDIDDDIRKWKEYAEKLENELKTLGYNDFNKPWE